MESTEDNAGGAPTIKNESKEGASKPRSRSPSPKRSASRSPPRSVSRSPPKKSGSGSPARRSGSPARRSASPARKRSRSPGDRRSRSPASRSRSRSPKRGGARRSRSRSRSRGRKSPPENVPPCDVLGVFGLNPTTTRRDLEDEFSRFPEYDRVDLIIDRQTMRSKCFGFVYFKTVEGALKAKEEMVGVSLHGRDIRVDFSKTKRAHSPTPGKYLGKSSRSRNNDRGYHPYSRYPSSTSSYDYYGGGRRSPPRRDYYDDRDRYDRGDRYDRDRYSDRYSSSSSSSYDRYDRPSSSSYDRPPSYDYGRRPYR